MREVMTPQGEALVYARLQGGGTSTMTVQRIVNRLRSNALLHGFEIYILTPSAERGKSRAEQHDSFLHVLTVNPVHEKLAHVKRVKKPAHGERTTDPSPVIPPDWRGQELREQWAALPERSLDILGLTTEQRIEQAMLALECDQVLSDAQLKKHFGLVPEDLPKIRLVKTIIRPTFGATAQEEMVTFACLTNRIANLDDNKLGHRAGTAEMRMTLNAPAGPHWQAEARGALRYEEPDALWQSEGGDVAIEYDTGSYGMPTVHRKLDSFADRGFTRVIWAANSPTRRKNLSEKLGDKAPEFIAAPWWKTDRDK